MIFSIDWLHFVNIFLSYKVGSVKIEEIVLQIKAMCGGHAGEMSQWLKELTFLLVYFSRVFKTHSFERGLTTASDSNCKGSNTSLGPFYESEHQ